MYTWFALAGEVPTSLLQIGASDAAERYEKAQRLLSSMSSFLQEHGIDELDGEENDFQDELNREDLKRPPRLDERAADNRERFAFHVRASRKAFVSVQHITRAAY